MLSPRPTACSDAQSPAHSRPVDRGAAPRASQPLIRAPGAASPASAEARPLWPPLSPERNRAPPGTGDSGLAASLDVPRRLGPGMDPASSGRHGSGTISLAKASGDEGAPSTPAAATRPPEEPVPEHVQTGSSECEGRIVVLVVAVLVSNRYWRKDHELWSNSP